jgi:hypothetical protein
MVSHNPVRSISHCCAICFSLVTAFSPARENLNKNKKCNGPLCPRTTSPIHLKTGNTKNLRVSSFDSFEVLMASFEEIQTENDASVYDIAGYDCSEAKEVLKRRNFLQSLLASTMAAPAVANAYEKSYPVNLDFVNDDSTINLESIREKRIAVQKSQVKSSKEEIIKHPFSFQNTKDILGSLVWSGALWFLLGSRSNPIVKPVANILYDENTNKGSWLKDRNDGLFSDFPLAFSILMTIIFLMLGIITDRLLLFSTAGDSNIVLQLAGVSLIGGASLELGRIASNEKMQTREDSERDETLANEFEEFATKKLVVGQGGSIHRNEVTKLFRRYFAKYRVENDEFPLSDIEIERLFRAWNRKNGNNEDVSSAGFLKNVKVNEQAQIKL